MKKVAGRFVALSPQRRMICDFLAAGAGVPLITGQKKMNLSDIATARAAARPRPSWCAIFTKAMAIIGEKRPELRRTFVRWPWPRLYEYDTNVLTVVLERYIDGEPGLFPCRIRNPELLSLTELEAVIREHKTRPFHEIKRFVNALRMARLPGMIRRPLWWLAMNVFPKLKASLVGTHGITVTSGLGSTGLNVISPWTLAIHYDAPDAQGNLDVRTTFDHRVYDGAAVAQMAWLLEDTLNGPILEELRGLNPSRSLNRAA